MYRLLVILGILDIYLFFDGGFFLVADKKRLKTICISWLLLPLYNSYYNSLQVCIESLSNLALRNCFMYQKPPDEQISSAQITGRPVARNIKGVACRKSSEICCLGLLGTRPFTHKACPSFRHQYCRGLWCLTARRICCVSERRT